jgi:hypothetical protein
VSVTSNEIADVLAAILPNVNPSFCFDASSPSAVTPATRLVHVAVRFHGTSMRCRWTVVPSSNALTTSVAEWTVAFGGMSPPSR